MVIIYINFVDLNFPMAHAKLHDHVNSGSIEADFKKF